jgi:uncharacterized CHY-type Zn-finger protein
MLPKISEHMWCYHCEHEWETDDYYNCKECPNCKQEPIHIMRTSSTGYLYAWMAKHKDDIRDKKIDNLLNK